MPLANPGLGQSKTVEVIKTEEKGSDVNLAIHLLHDAYQSRYECAVIVSGDSDLLAAVQIKVPIVTPQQEQMSLLG
jgi:uncharacterized LabA/DUF88 family protein